MLGTIEEEVLLDLDETCYAHQVWKSIENKLLPSSKEKEVLLNETLMTLTKGNMSLDEYIRKFKVICDSLAAIKKPLDETNKVFQLARGLGPKYKDFRMAMLTKPPYPSYNQFIMSLKAHEQMIQLESRYSEHSTNHEQAYYGGRGRGRQYGGRFNSRGRGFIPATSQRYQAKNEQSRSHFDPKTSRGNTSFQGSQKDPQVMCQICGKQNHTTLKCWNHFNHSFQPEDELP